MRDESDENYFSLWGTIKRMYNAVLEFIRSFTIATEKGSEYKEGWLLKLARALGIILPGISNHTPQDYVNVTRLSPSFVFQIHRDVAIT